MAARSIIIDTDPGIDDALALFLACTAPELDVRAITTVAGNVGINRTTRNALYLTELAGRGDIRVYRGAEKPIKGTWSTIEGIHGQNGLGGVAVTPPQRTESGNAVDALIDLLSASPANSMTVVLIGPQTNLALALRRAPAIAGNIREVVVMGGSLDPEGGNATRYAEFNILVDPHAADIVLQAGRPMLWATLEVARQSRVGRAWIDELATGGPCARAAAAMMGFYLEHAKKDDGALYDPLTILSLLSPDLFEFRTASLSIETEDDSRYGQTRFNLGGSDGRIRVAVSCDVERVRQTLLDRLRKR